MIKLQPEKTEHVIATHTDWNLSWRIQFPEMIMIGDNVLKHFDHIEPNWEDLGSGRWGFSWQPDQAYAEAKRPKIYRDKDGNPIYDVTLGLALRAEIGPCDGGVEMMLSLANKTDQTIADVRCEGGCVSFCNDAFRGAEQDMVQRSYLMKSDKMMSLATLDRTLSSHCSYHTSVTEYDRPIEKNCEDFWGRSTVAIDSPAIIGMVSKDGSKAVVIGYDHSTSSQANASPSPCLHSKPNYGDIAPGQTVSRTGYILFGDDIHKLAAELHERIA